MLYQVIVFSCVKLATEYYCSISDLKIRIAGDMVFLLDVSFVMSCMEINELFTMQMYCLLLPPT